MRIILLLIIGFLVINANGQAVRNLNGNATNLTMRGSTVIRTNLLVDATGTNSIGSSNVLEVLTAGNVKAFQVGTDQNVQCSGSTYQFGSTASPGALFWFDGNTHTHGLEYYNGSFLFYSGDGSNAKFNLESGLSPTLLSSSKFQWANSTTTTYGQSSGTSISRPSLGTVGISTNLIVDGTITTSNLTVNGTQTVAAMYPTNIISPGKSNGVWGISADGTWVKTNDISTLTATNPASWSGISVASLASGGTLPAENGQALTSLQSTNGVINTFIFPSQSNTLTMNNAGYVLNTSSNFSITNITGNVSGSYLSWASLIVSNQNANNITGYCTVPASRIMGTGSTNGIIVPTGKTAIFTLLSWGNTITNWWNILQQ